MNKIMGFFICMLLIVTSLSVVGQEKDVLTDNNGDKWIKSFGGEADDYGSCVQQTSDGGFIVFGFTKSYGVGRDDFWLIKTDSLGKKIWEKTYGGEETDLACFGRQTNDGGFIVVGDTRSFDVGNNDIWLIKTYDTGEMIWDKTFGGADFDHASEVWQTDDGGFVVFGYTESFGSGSRDMWLIKTDADGDVLWDKTYGGPMDDQGHSMKQTNDGGFILTGGTYTTETTNKFDIWLIKTDNAGEIIWDKIYGGSEHETAWSIQQTTDGGYIICAEIEVGGLDKYNIKLLKTDSTGELLWEKIFGGFNWQRGWAVQQTTDGGYAIAGDTFVGPRVDGLLIKTDSTGEKQWSKTYGNYNTDITLHVEQTNDGGYILTGYHQPKRFEYRDLWIIKTDDEGNVARNRIITNTFLMRFLERFPNAFPLLRQILL
jgi:hypothetical protein